MHIGISVLLSNIEEGLRLCRNNPIITHIEVGIDNLNDCEKLQMYKGEIDNLNLSMGIHLPLELNTCENVEFIRDSWIDFVSIVCNKLKDFNIKYYNLHLGYARSQILKDYLTKYLNNTVDFFDKLSLRDDTKNEIFTLENTYSKGGDIYCIGNNMEIFRYIFNNSMNKNLYFCYDSGHDLINRSDYFSLSDKFKVIHLSNNYGKEDEHLGLSNGLLSDCMIKKMINSDAEILVLEMNLDEVKNSISYLEKTYLEETLF